MSFASGFIDALSRGLQFHAQNFIEQKRQQAALQADVYTKNPDLLRDPQHAKIFDSIVGQKGAAADFVAAIDAGKAAAEALAFEPEASTPPVAAQGVASALGLEAGVGGREPSGLAVPPTPTQGATPPTALPTPLSGTVGGRRLRPGATLTRPVPGGGTVSLTAPSFEERRLVDPTLRELDVRTRAQVAGTTERAKQRVQLEFAGPKAEATAKGAELGKAKGAAEAAGLSGRVQFGDRVVDVPLLRFPELVQRGSLGGAIVGVDEAVDLGARPSDEQLRVLDAQGFELLTDGAGQLIAVPGDAARKAGLATAPVSTALRTPETQQVLSDANFRVGRLLADQKFLGSFPLEAKLGRIGARSAATLLSPVRALTDDPKVLAQRREVAQFGFRMARLLGSNSQLSDAERAAAQKVLEPIITGRFASREVVVAGLLATREFLRRIDARTRGLEAVPATTAPPLPPRVERELRKLQSLERKAAEAGGRSQVVEVPGVGPVEVIE